MTRYFFLKDLFLELHWALFDSLDKEQNNWEFSNRNEETQDRVNYTRIKTILNMINSFKKKRKKITNKQLISLGSNIDKTDKKEVEFLIQRLMAEINYSEHKYKEGYSFRDYLRDNEKLKENDNKSYIKQNKLLRMNTTLFNTLSKEYYHKSGIKVDIENKKIPELEDRETIELNNNIFVTQMLDYLKDTPKKRI